MWHWGFSQPLDQILLESVYLDPVGQEYQVAACMIDTMGTRTPEIYRYGAKNRGRVYPRQGVASMSQPYRPSLQEICSEVMGRKIKIPGGVNLWRCDTTFFKNDLSFRLAVSPDGPGPFLLHSNGDGELEEYARKMCAEVYDEEAQAWVNPRKKSNHYLRPPGLWKAYSSLTPIT